MANLRKTVTVELKSDADEFVINVDDVRVNESGALLFFRVTEANIAEIIGGIAHGNWEAFTVEPFVLSAP